MLAEKQTQEALELLKKEWDEMVEFHNSRRHGEIDSLRIDFSILLRSRLVFPLQIKSNPTSVRKHIQKAPFIVVMFVGPQHTSQQIAHRIKRLILRSYQRIQRSPLPT